jgi:hypothetical protein
MEKMTRKQRLGHERLIAANYDPSDSRTRAGRFSATPPSPGRRRIGREAVGADGHPDRPDRGHQAWLPLGASPGGATRRAQAHRGER